MIEMIGRWLNFICLNVCGFLLVYSYILSVMPVTRAERRGEKAWKECAIFRNLNRVIEFILLTNLILWTQFPIPELNWIVYENLLIGIIIGIAILIPSLVIWIKGLKDAGKETFIPLKEKVLNKGIFKYIRHPQTVGGFPLFIVFAFMLNSLFLVVWSAIYLLISVPIIMYFEEKDLVKRFGDAYIEYKRTTGAFFPKVWKKKEK
ncbi:MAG: hypothetical protein HWN66_02525 [Candidatus Helarchaeota archaeon]|nr:hypothetical protein [Candidatus Helarchaeota archaeon]